MFEPFVNDLRLVRRRASMLDPVSFRVLDMQPDSDRPAGTRSGWALCASGDGPEQIALSWPWVFIPPGIGVVEPLKIQTNALLLDAVGKPMQEYETLGALLVVVNQIAWHDLAAASCC